MQKKRLSAGDNVPDSFDVLIEISMNESHVKYEFDKELEFLRVDRFFKAPMYYPFNYGYIPGTCGGDGDPLDVMVVCPHPIIPCTLIECRPVGVLLMDDEGGRDEKIIAVPHEKISPSFLNVNSLADLHSEVAEKIEHFFSYYKAVDNGKWVKIERWGSVEEAKSIIKGCIINLSK